MNTQLFEGELIRLGALDAERDAEIESKWTHDPEFLRALSAEPMRALSPNQIKKKYAEIEKKEGTYYFAMRARADDRALGVARLIRIAWTNGNAWLILGIGDAADRGKGYGTETLQLILRYAFGELNLFRVSVAVPEYNASARRLFERAGFAIEVRKRDAIHRAGKRWELIVYGLLREDWQVSGNA